MRVRFPRGGVAIGGLSALDFLDDTFGALQQGARALALAAEGCTLAGELRLAADVAQTGAQLRRELPEAPPRLVLERGQGLGAALVERALGGLVESTSLAGLLLRDVTGAPGRRPGHGADDTDDSAAASLARTSAARTYPPLLVAPGVTEGGRMGGHGGRVAGGRLLPLRVVRGAIRRTPRLVLEIDPACLEAEAPLSQVGLAQVEGGAGRRAAARTPALLLLEGVDPRLVERDRESPRRGPRAPRWTSPHLFAALAVGLRDETTEGVAARAQLTECLATLGREPLQFGAELRELSLDHSSLDGVAGLGVVVVAGSGLGGPAVACARSHRAVGEASGASLRRRAISSRRDRTAIARNCSINGGGVSSWVIGDSRMFLEPGPGQARAKCRAFADEVSQAVADTRDAARRRRTVELGLDACGREPPEEVRGRGPAIGCGAHDPREELLVADSREAQLRARGPDSRRRSLRAGGRPSEAGSLSTNSARAAWGR